MPHRKGKKTTGAKSAAKSAANSLSAALALAEQFNNSGNPQKIIDTLSVFESSYPFPTTLERGQYNRLLGFGYAHARRWQEAERILLRGLSEFPDALDFLYGLTYVRLSLREYSEAKKTGERFRHLVQSTEPGSLQSQPLNGAINQAAHLLNYLGLAYQETGDPTSAITCYEQAIAAAPTLHLPYLNLTQLLQRQNRSDEARQILDRGLKSCSQVNELQMLTQSLQRKATISACLMVKNEEEMLPACLDSIRTWVDEIIIVDTGSTDRTMEIARSYGALVYQHPWEGSFSKSRNFTLQYATKDWQFIIDADERVYPEDVPQILATVNRSDIDVVTMNVYNVYEEHRDVIVFLPSHRIFRRELNVHYEGIVHNQLVVPDSARYCRIGARIKHLGYGLSKEKMAAKTLRTKTLLEKQLAENPDNAFALFNYAQLLRSTPDGFKPENADTVIKSATRAVELTSADDPTQRHIHLMCLDQLGWTYYYLGKYDLALKYAQTALSIKADYLDPTLLCAYVHFRQNDLPTSTRYFERYLSVQAAYDPSKEMDNIILVNLNARADALFNLGAIAELQENPGLAKRRYRESLAANPDCTDALLNLGRLLLGEGNIAEAEGCLARLVDSGRATPATTTKLVNLYLERGEANRAQQLVLDALKMHPQAPELQIALADIHLARGAFDDAIAALQSASTRDSANLDLAAKLGDVFARTGRFDEAIALYAQTAEKTSLSADMLNDLGNCYYRTKRFADAVTTYVAALEQNPKLTTARRNLGLAYAQVGQTAEAITELSAFLESNAEQADLHHVIADLYVKRGGFTSGLWHYEQYLRTYPSDLRALFRLADCYLHMGHKDSAVAGFRRILQLEPDFAPAIERLASLGATSGKLDGLVPVTEAKGKVN